MSIYIHDDLQNTKIIDWSFVHIKLLNLQSRIVQQLKKKNFRKARQLQRLMLKSYGARLLISQKFISLKQSAAFRTYKIKRKTPYLNSLNLNNFIQFEDHFIVRNELQNFNRFIYLSFLSLLWVLALIPVNETFSAQFSYNSRLYRNQSDVLKELELTFNCTYFKWLLVIKPTGFFTVANKVWLYQNALMEKKFLKSVLESKKFANYARRYYNHKGVIETKKISLTKLIKSSCFYEKSLLQYFKLIKDSHFNKKNNSLLKDHIIFYNSIFFSPSTNLNHIKTIYKSIFHFLNERGLNIKKNRVWVINMFDGCHFLGWFLKKDKSNKINIQISTYNIKSHQLSIKKFLKSSRFLTIDKVIIQLNKKILNWQSHYAYTSNLYQTWSEMNYYLFWRMWRWCKKRHKNKGSKWLYHRYWLYREKKKWVFHSNQQYLQQYYLKPKKILFLPASINACEVKNWQKIKGLLLQRHIDLKLY